MRNLIIHIYFLLFSFVCFSQAIVLDKIKCKVDSNDLKAIKEMIKFQTYYYKPLFNKNLDTINIKVYGRYKAYIKVRESMISFDTHMGYGFYSPKTKTIYVYKQDNYINIIYHEINHAIVHQIIGGLPIWINEGMAEFFESFTFKHTGLSMKFHDRSLKMTRKWMIEKKVNLLDLLNYSHSEWYQKNFDFKGYSYSVSYSFVCYLYLKYPESIILILKDIMKGKNSIEAIQSATKREIEFIENEFFRYMKGNHLQHLMRMKYVES